MNNNTNNTRFHYFFRDPSNYKTYIDIVLRGEMTEADYCTLCENLHEGEWFIPSQVGLDEEKEFDVEDFDDDYEDDSCPWFEAFGHDIVPSTIRPADLSVEELVRRFKEIGPDGWIPQDY